MENPFRGAGAPPTKELIERVLAAAARAVKKERFEGKVVEIARQKEGMRIKIVGSGFCDGLRKVVDSWPAIKDIPEIYQELADALFGIENIERAKASLKKSSKRAKELQMYYLRKLKRARHTQDMRILRKEFYGRVVTEVKRNKKALKLLHEAGKALRKLPDFEEAPTVIIAGLPNVGKSSLLKCITGSRPEIALYPFTTKGLMIGYAEINFNRIQFIDTPGLLDRPLAKRNKAELQAIAALKHLADLILYVYDVSETCGYSIEQQKRLLKEIKKLFRKPVIVAANKVDIVGGWRPEEIGGIPLSCQTGVGISEIKSLIKEKLKIK